MRLKAFARWTPRTHAPGEQASLARQDFVSLVSHELRSPLSAVVGGAKTLQQRWPDLSDDQRNTLLALIVGEAKRLASLVDDLLDSASIDAGSFSYAFTDVDVGALTREAVATAAAAQDGVEVVARLPEALPVVRGDAARLRQVLANLIDNAIKYSPAGAVVEVEAAEHGGRLEIAVIDHGTGIAFENQAAIFERFGRVAGPDAKPGTGLGLYIARSIAEAHGGTVAVASSPGRGARFTLTLGAGGS